TFLRCSGAAVRMCERSSDVWKVGHFGPATVCTSASRPASPRASRARCAPTTAAPRCASRGVAPGSTSGRGTPAMSSRASSPARTPTRCRPSRARNFTRSRFASRRAQTAWATGSRATRSRFASASSCYRKAWRSAPCSSRPTARRSCSWRTGKRQAGIRGSAKWRPSTCRWSPNSSRVTDCAFVRSSSKMRRPCISPPNRSWHRPAWRLRFDFIGLSDGEPDDRSCRSQLRHGRELRRVHRRRGRRSLSLHHVGHPSVMRKTVASAKQRGVAVGAHPSLPDLVGFGRRVMDVSPDDVYDLVVYQVGALIGVAHAAKVEMQHVKAHGALYNMAAANGDLAAAIARAVRDVDPELTLFGLPASHLARAGEAAGLRVACEAFADRNYMPDG